MLGKLIRSVTGDADKRARDANEAASATLRKLEAAAEVEDPMQLRGSGSWDTDYSTAQEMQPLPPLVPVPPSPPKPRPPARVAIHPMRMMTPAHMTLYALLADYLEVEAPQMSLHAQVAMDSFLHVDRRAARADQAAVHATFIAEHVDLLVIDESGLPIVAVSLVGNGESAGQSAVAKANALEEAGLGHVSVNELTPPADIWAQVRMHIEFNTEADDDLVQAILT